MLPICKKKKKELNKILLCMLNLKVSHLNINVAMYKTSSSLLMFSVNLVMTYLRNL